MVTWGVAIYGGDSSAVAAQLASGVVMVVGSVGAFAAVKADGSIVTVAVRLARGQVRVTSREGGQRLDGLFLVVSTPI